LAIIALKVPYQRFPITPSHQLEDHVRQPVFSVELYYYIIKLMLKNITLKKKMVLVDDVATMMMMHYGVSAIT